MCFQSFCLLQSIICSTTRTLHRTTSCSFLAHFFGKQGENRAPFFNRPVQISHKKVQLHWAQSRSKDLFCGVCSGGRFQCCRDCKMWIISSFALNGLVFACNLCNPPLHFNSSLHYLQHLIQHKCYVVSSWSGLLGGRWQNKQTPRSVCTVGIDIASFFLNIFCQRLVEFKNAGSCWGVISMIAHCILVPCSMRISELEMPGNVTIHGY